MYDDEGYYVILTDPETETEEYFKALCAEDVIIECDRLAEEAWYNDYALSHGYIIEEEF